MTLAGGIKTLNNKTIHWKIRYDLYGETVTMPAFLFNKTDKYQIITCKEIQKNSEKVE